MELNCFWCFFCEVHVQWSPLWTHGFSQEAYLEAEGATKNKDFYVVPPQESDSYERKPHASIDAEARDAPSRKKIMILKK
jgi:hypothetical protein